ncbi:CDP-glycerol glycerophosphotransferase [Nocardioides ginsengisegetis]|uniref:CDP-glycerol glycerophosphotransferase n=1 Tax=Nocardioides ginsengisegetis TaxID=661491 RepID=A0A7W3J2Q3_9ACTN|nr:glycosyltransferase family 2 protein [Nocardioides ginsengisegetis]MBA8805210.1 CDP-glycerol glycerophosphotransferase [Nocardioides ginsengisegetis]
MRFGRRRAPLVSVVVPVYAVEAWLPACLDSALEQRHRDVEVVVVDDGSPDESGEIADSYAARDPRVRVVHTDNHGLGAARNEGLRHVTGDYVTFLDSDDVVPRDAWSTLVRSLEGSGSDFATGSIVRWESDGLHEPPWMRRLHATRRLAAGITDHPEILGDVFAWNKMFRRSFWESAGLSWPEGVRYEDQPTTTRAFLAGRFDVLPEVVYHWRIRDDGTSITQQRSSLQDLADRWETKRMALRSVEEYADPRVLEIFRDRVLAGDLHRYFTEIPGCPDEWWSLLQAGVVEMWGDRSLVHSGLPPVHRLTGWLVEQDRRADAAAVMEYAAGLGRPVDRVTDDEGPRIDVPVIDRHSVDRAALAVREHEV